MHDIQTHILKKLSSVASARYADLKPKTIEGNLFVYHLKALMREGYIKCQNDRYVLTSKGKQFVDRVSFETFRERIQPKIVTIIILKNKNGEYLLYRRRRTPFIGKIGFPYGKIHLEERVLDSAKRELFEKTGLQAKLSHRGDVYITVYDEMELLSHMFCHIFTGTNISGELRTEATIGECFWKDIKEIAKKDLIPGVLQIEKLLKKQKSLFFAEYFLNVGE